MSWGFGGRRRVESALRGRLRPNETVEAHARDDIGRDDWVLTSQRLLVVRQGVIAQEVDLSDAVGAVTDQSVGVAMRVHSRRSGGGQMLATFRTPNDLTRRMATVLQRPQQSS